MSSLAGTEVQTLLDDAARRAGRYLAGLDERPVAPDDAALAGLARFDEPLPQVAGDQAATLALLDEAGSAATVASAGGRYFGFVIKWLNVPYDCGIALVRHPGDLRRSFAVTAGYLPPDTGFEATNSTPQSCRHAQVMAAHLGQAGLEVLNDVVLNQVLVRAAAEDIGRSADAILAAAQLVR
jgi:hypothetical protein